MLEVKELVKIYSSSKGVKGITFTLNRGEILGLVGNNGAGKTTLMKILMTFLKVDKGVILLDGKDIFKNRKFLLSKTSAVIEQMEFYPELSGYEHLKMIKDIREISNDDFNEVIEFVDIGKMLKRKTSNYSLGMKQRLAIGIALLSSKDLLILDEPTNGLDQRSIIKLIKLLKRYKNKGVGILISSHTLADLEELCDRFLFLDDGVIINEVSKDEISKSMYLIELKDSSFLEESSLRYKYEKEISNSIIVNENELTLELKNLINNNIEIDKVKKVDNSLKKIYLEYFKE